ncbi:MAG: RelA/SpoT family protein [Thermoanaerobaculia bacterium]
MPSISERLARRRVLAPVVPPERVTLADIERRLEDHGRPYDSAFLSTVHDFSAAMHTDQLRRSGEPYLTHPLQVAHCLADLGFDALSVAVGLLHDVLEDTLTTKEALAERFGAEIAELVDGVTKIGRHSYFKRDQAQAETFRKLILASVADLRVILVKLADRWHNMATLEHLAPETRRRVAQETLEIYAPIAMRLGMSKLQGDLEDLAFFHLYPHQFGELRAQIEERLKGARRRIDDIRAGLAERLRQAGIEADISYRVKRYQSIYRKLRKQGIEVSQVYDYLAFRVVTLELRDCYAALGVVHQAWRPVPGRIKDYIAMPKPNLYQSLHTTLVGESGEPFEVQIRTRDMDRVAEEGIAAHWRYKEEGAGAAGEPDRNILWLRQLVEWQKEVADPRSFLTALKVDLYPDEVYVFTPKGDVHAFPHDATPLDFAYKIHTDLGHHCVGARINGKLVPLKTLLENGDIVEVLTSSSRTPSRDWLKFVVTSRAKSKIRHWLSTEQKKRAIEIGRRLLEREARKLRIAARRVLEGGDLATYLEREGIGNADDLLAAIGFGKLTARQVIHRVLPADQFAAAVAPEPGRLRRAVSRVLPFGGSPALVVKGHGDLMAYVAKCCSPLPGEDVVGYVTRGRGVSVHSVDCPNVKNLLYHPEREIEVEWVRGADAVFPVILAIETEDRPGMLARLTEAIARSQGNIRQIEAATRETGRGLIEVVVEVRDGRHLERLSQALRDVDGVLEVRRPMGEPTHPA